MGLVFEKMCRYYTLMKGITGEYGCFVTSIRRGKLIGTKYKISKYIFFSLSGYTDRFETLPDEEVLLLTLDSLYE